MKNFNNIKISLPIPIAIGLTYLTFFIALLMLWACEDFVEVELPNSELIADNVFEEKATANAAMTDIYSKIRDGGLLSGSSLGLSHLLGNYADELDFYGNTEHGAFAFYNNTLIPSNPDVKKFWNSSYNQIYGANAIIEGVEKAISLPSVDRSQLKGEALFVRALIHFYLTNLFGDIPYVVTTNYEENQALTKLPISEVYNYAITDLKEAILLLPEDYFTANRVRPNKSVAYALLARVNLYAGFWDKAATAASMVLNDTQLYVFEQDLDKAFLKESMSILWQLSPRFNDGNTLEGETFIFKVGPPPLSALTSKLMTAFTIKDLRKEHWIQAVTDGTLTWYHPYKYKIKNGGSSVENSIIFRLAEVYLIRAEAKARKGDLEGARGDLNKIKNRAGLEDTLALTQEEILDAIFEERRLELFTEMGHRFFDLKRINKVHEVLSESKSGWNTHDILFPIPELELVLNPNLRPQNPGY